MNKKIMLPIVMALVLCVTVLGFAGAPKTFTDLAKGHWAYDSVARMSEAGIISGYPDGSFKPNSYITYAEFIKMALVSTGDDPGAASGGNHWGKNYYDKGFENGWYNENDISEKVLGQPIDRQHMALIASRIINKEEKAIESYGIILDSISDVDISNRYEFEIVTAYGAGILAGYGDGTFKPEGRLTRAESSSVILRLIDESARTIPDLDKLTKDVEDVEAQEEAENDRPKSKLETMQENAAAVISFDPKADVLPNGAMSEEKSIQYLDKLFDSIMFSGSNGSYYFDATFPELPKGFSWRIVVDVNTTMEASEKGNRSWWLTTDTDILNKERILHDSKGAVKRQVTDVSSLKDLSVTSVTAEIVNDEGLWTCRYGLLKGYSDIYIESQNLAIGFSKDKSQIEFDYDINRHFQWK